MLKTFLATFLGVLAAIGVAALVYTLHEDRRAKEARESAVATCEERLTPTVSRACERHPVLASAIVGITRSDVPRKP